VIYGANHRVIHMNQKKINIHLVSDSTGETVSSVCRSVMAQFDSVEVEEHVWSLIRTPRQLERVMETVKQAPGIVMYTVMNENLLRQLEDACHDLEVPCIPVLEEVIDQVSTYLGIKMKRA